MSFNVRYDEEADGELRWANRRPVVVDAIRAHAPDLLALQEPTDEQFEEIAAQLAELSPLDGGFVRSARFDMLDGGAFPVVADKSRTCAWNRLRDRQTRGQLIFARTHFDTAADTWLASAGRLHAGIDAVSHGLPVILAGDFNCAAGSAAHQYLLGDAGFRDTWYESSHVDRDSMTYNGFTRLACLPRKDDELERFLESTSPRAGEFAHYHAHVRRHGNYRIDWILIRGDVTCESASIDLKQSSTILASDHFPVVAAVACDAGNDVAAHRRP